MSAGAAVRRRAIQPLNPLRTALALVRELFIVHLIIYICTDEYDMGGGGGLSTNICIDEYVNV